MTQAPRVGDRIVRTLTIEGTVGWVGSTQCEVDGFVFPYQPVAPVVAISEVPLSLLHDGSACGRPERVFAAVPDQQSLVVEMIDTMARETHDADHAGALSHCSEPLCLLRAAVFCMDLPS
jgi:hypothetical protein